MSMRDCFVFFQATPTHTAASCWSRRSNRKPQYQWKRASTCGDWANYLLKTNKVLTSIIMQIYIKTLTGRTVSLIVEEGETIKTVKEKLKEKDGVPVEEQRLVFNSQELEDGKTLQYYGILREATLHVVINPRARRKWPCTILWSERNALSRDWNQVCAVARNTLTLSLRAFSLCVCVPIISVCVLYLLSKKSFVSACINVYVHVACRCRKHFSPSPHMLWVGLASKQVYDSAVQAKQEALMKSLPLLSKFNSRTVFYLKS